MVINANAISQGVKNKENEEKKEEVIEEKQEVKQETKQEKTENKKEEKPKNKDKKDKKGTEGVDYSLRTKKEKPVSPGRKKMKKDGIKKTYYIDREITFQISEEAFELGMSSDSAFIEYLVRNHMKKKK